MLKKIVLRELEDHFKMRDFMINHKQEILDFAKIVLESLKKGGCIFWCGNGGSAADSQHLAAELVGRFEKERKPIKSISLTTDTSILTALSNDYSYDIVFKRQLQALGKPKDILIAISTSGNSKNVIEVLKEAKKKKIKSLAILGKNGGKAKKFAYKSIIIKSKKTSRIQEMHILIGHIICQIAEHGTTKG